MKITLLLSIIFIPCALKAANHLSSKGVAASRSLVDSNHLMDPDPTTKERHDPFVGTFNVSANGQSGGTLTITHLGGNTYQVATDSGADNATRMGNYLEGISEGVPFKIIISGNHLAMELLGTRIDLIRTSSGTATTHTPASPGGKIDPRLIGIWSNSTAYNSGNAGTSSRTRIGFSSNGTFEIQKSFSAGGDGWSTGETTDPVEQANYTISNMNAQGGTVLINGQAMEYEFYTFDGEQKLIFANYKTPWVKIQ